VRKGDTLNSVADNFGVSIERLRRWNHLRGAYLRPGRTLWIHLPVTPGQEVAAAPSRSSKSKKAGKIRASASAKPMLHKVHRGETLTSIASEYNTTVYALRRDNRKVAANLRAGDVLVIRENR
jgi:membrane-bound lytic murein transglycosylase D